MDDVETMRRDLHDLMGAANPAVGKDVQESSADPLAQQALRDIISGQRVPAPENLRGGLTPPIRVHGDVASRRPSRRLALLAAAVAGLAAVALVAQNGPGSQPAQAALPPVLPYALPAGAPAAPELLKIADAAAVLPAEPSGRYSYLRSAGWSLNTAVADGMSTSSLDSRQAEVWRAADGSGVILRQKGPSMVHRVGSQETYDALRGSTASVEQRRELTAGDPLSMPVDLQTLPWDDPAQFAKTVNDHPNASIPVAVDTVDAINRLFATQVLQPAERAKLWTLLASVPGVTYRGPLLDRLGRAGEAFTVEDDGSARGLPTQQLLIIDPATGLKLESDEVLTKEAGKLNLPIPAVVGIGLLIQANLVEAVEQRPA